MRALGAIVAGLIAGLMATIVIGIVGIGMTYPHPAPVDLGNSRQIVESFTNMPVTAKIALMVAWFVGALAGAAIAKRVERKSWIAWTVTALIAAYVMMNTLFLPAPAWMQALSIAAPLIGGFIGNHLVKSGPPAEEPATDV